MKPQLLGDDLSLAELAGAERAAIHLHQPHEVRIDCAEELEDLVKIAAGPAQVAGIGEGKVKMAAVAGGIPDIVEQKSQPALRSVR